MVGKRHMREIVCNACKQTVEVRSRFTGLKVECPHCHAPVLVPPPESLATAGDETAEPQGKRRRESGPEHGRPGPPTAPMRQSTGPQDHRGWPSFLLSNSFIGALVVCVMALAVLLGLQVWDRSAQDGEASPPKSKASRGEASLATGDAAASPVTGRTRVVAVPILGPINADTAALLERGLDAAAASGADCVVLVLDTPGGGVEAVDTMASCIDRYDEDMDFVAYVHGEQFGGAWSAGAFLAFCCNRIIMRNGCAIGAAQQIQVHPLTGVWVPTKDTPAGEKFDSARIAKMRARAEQNGHPPAVAAAMADQDMELWLVETGGGPQFIAHYGDGQAPNGRKLKAKGKILSLTAGEMAELGLSQTVEGPEDCGNVLKAGNPLDGPLYRKLAAEAELELQEFTLAQKEAQRQSEVLDYHLKSIDWQLGIANPEQKRTKLAGRDPGFAEHVAGAIEACDALLELAKKHPGLGTPVAYLRGLRTELRVAQQAGQ